MAQTNEIPILLVYMFGEGAEQVWRMSTARVLLWCRAFDDWLAEVERRQSRRTYATADLAWKRFLGHLRKMPWGVSPADIESHAAWLESKGLSLTTRNGDLSALSKFYRWCDERRLDPACEPGFNPAGEVRREWAKRPATPALSAEQARHFLEFLRLVKTPSGLRDYAFVLACLGLDAPLDRVAGLKWGQIEMDENGACVSWAPGAPPSRLPEAAWEAIRLFLEASGRMDGLLAEPDWFPELSGREAVDSAGECVFPRLADSAAASPDGSPGGEARDWNVTKSIPPGVIEDLLKQYGSLIGIPARQQTLQAFQRARAGLSLEEVLPAPAAGPASMPYLASTPDPASSPYPASTSYPASIPLPSEDETAGLPAALLEDGAGPDEKLRWQDFRGTGWLQEIIDNMRALSARLLDLARRSRSVPESASLLDAQVLLVTRISALVSARRERGEASPDDLWVQEFKDMMENVAQQEQGAQPGEATREIEEGAAELASKPFEEVAGEIGTVRAAMHSFFNMAMGAKEPAVVVRLSNSYGRSALRLLKLMNANQLSENMEAVFLRKTIDDVIEEMTGEILEIWEQREKEMAEEARQRAANPPPPH